ncbi:hypothetical protein ACFOPS_16755 [Ralstonia solanacearum]|uniref:hypothetical protein n=1 Tax=Ralstonia solanacearum TaxID=305 RepID=UPI00361CB489
MEKGLAAPNVGAAFAAEFEKIGVISRNNTTETAEFIEAQGGYLGGNSRLTERPSHKHISR